jgi:hypothetical protein
LLCLCHKARTLALPQISSAFFDGRTPSARRSLRRLEAQGFVRLEKRPAKVLPAGPPLYAGDPKVDEPGDWDAIVRSCRRRFDGAELHLCVSPTSRAANLVGGRATESAIAELSHDLMLGTVVLSMRQSGPEDYLHLVREDLFEEEEKAHVVPDARIKKHSGEAALVEVVGATYSAARLSDIYHLAAAEGCLVLLV